MLGMVCINWGTHAKSEVLMNCLLLAVMVQSVCRLGSLVLGPLVSSVEEQLIHINTTTRHLEQEAAYLRNLLQKNNVEIPKQHDIHC